MFPADPPKDAAPRDFPFFIAVARAFFLARRALVGFMIGLVVREVDCYVRAVRSKCNQVVIPTVYVSSRPAPV